MAGMDGLCRALPQMDYFQILRLGAAASPEEIKNAFYKQSRTFHPDRFFHITDAVLRTRVNEIYKRITEAYYVLRDDLKRRKYVADISGPDRAQKLRFTEADEVQSRQAAKKEREEEVGLHPKGRQFFQTALRDVAAERWAVAERNLKTALTYEPSNTRYREKLNEVQQKLKSDFKIR
jgi:DnaJ-class molecular chaperone